MSNFLSFIKPAEHGFLSFLGGAAKGAENAIPQVVGGIAGNPALGKPITNLAADVATAPLKFGAQLGVSATGGGKFAPQGGFQQALLGKKPISSVSETGKSTLQGVGVPKGPASALGLPAGLALGALSGPIGGPEKQGAEEAANVGKPLFDSVGPGLVHDIGQAPDVLQSAVSKLTGALSQSKGAIANIEKQRSVELGKRAGAAAGQITGEGGATQFHRALSQLKGPLTDTQPVLDMAKLDPNETQSLFNHIGQSNLSTFDQIHAYEGLNRVLQGQAPQRSQLANLEHIFGSDFAKTVMDSTGAGRNKIIQGIVDVANIPRSIISSFDASAPLRQGLVLSVAHPLNAVKSGGEMFKQAFSPKAFGEWLDTAEQSPQFARAKDSGLYLADPRKVSGGLGDKEESFMSNIAEKIPILGSGVKASERAYVGYLNKMRWDTFNQVADTFTKNGIGDQANLKSLGDFINNATGRGKLPFGAEKVAPELNSVFFSPRLMASRMNFFNPNWYIHQTPAVRQESAKAFAGVLGTGLTILSLAKAAGADVQADPRSSDFGKIKVGNNRWDIWGGFQQFARAGYQIASGQQKTASGASAGEVKKADRLDTAVRFLRSKASPTVGAGINIAEGSDLVGNKVTPQNQAYSLAVPLWIQDMQSAFQGQGGGVGAGLSTGVPSFFGVGAQSFQPKSSSNLPTGGATGSASFSPYK